MTKRCARCGESKAFSEFHRLSRAADGLQPRCKACIREYQRANRDKVNASKRAGERRTERARETGLNSDANIVAACRFCNASKGANPPVAPSGQPMLL